MSQKGDHIISEKKFRVQFLNAATESGTPETVVDIFDYIDEWWGWGIDRLARALYGNTGPIRVRVNSYGGDLLQGLAIMNLLRAHPGEVTAEVMGIAASAATFVVAGADKVEMREGSFLMIHNPFSVAIGTADEMQSSADALRKMEDEMANVYLSGMRKRKKMEGVEDAKALKQIREWMNSETWFTSSEAVENGFADIVSKDGGSTDTAIQSAASASHDTAMQYQNTPQRVWNLISQSKNTDMSKENTSILDKIKALLTPQAEGDATAAEGEQSTDNQNGADPVEEAKKTLEAAGFTVSKTDTEGAENAAKTAEEKPADGAKAKADASEKTYTEAEIAGLVAQALKEHTSASAAAKSPIQPGSQPKTQNRADALRARELGKFEALANLVKTR